MKASKHSHMYDTKYDYRETLKWEGKTRVGITPTNLHYYSNKVNLIGLQCLIIKYDLPCEGSTLLKALETIISHCVRGLHTYNKVRTLLGDLQRSDKTTLLKDLPLFKLIRTDSVLDS